MDDAVRTKGEFGSWIQLRDRGRSTWNDRRPSGMNVKREERRSLPAQLLPSASPTVSLLFAELSSGEVSRRQPSSPPGYEIASLPRGVITKNQAKRPKSHHRASTLFLQFWRGAIDTHAGPLFARLSSRRSSLPPPSLSVSYSFAVSIPPRRSREPSGKYVGRKGILSVVGFLRSLRQPVDWPNSFVFIYFGIYKLTHRGVQFRLKITWVKLGLEFYP